MVQVWKTRRAQAKDHNYKCFLVDSLGGISIQTDERVVFLCRLALDSNVSICVARLCCEPALEPQPFECKSEHRSSASRAPDHPERL